MVSRLYLKFCKVLSGRRPSWLIQLMAEAYDSVYQVAIGLWEATIYATFRCSRIQLDQASDPSRLQRKWRRQQERRRVMLCLYTCQTCSLTYILEWNTHNGGTYSFTSCITHYTISHYLWFSSRAPGLYSRNTHQTSYLFWDNLTFSSSHVSNVTWLNSRQRSIKVLILVANSHVSFPHSTALSTNLSPSESGSGRITIWWIFRFPTNPRTQG